MNINFCTIHRLLIPFITLFSDIFLRDYVISVALRQQNRSSSYRQSYCRDFLHEREMSFDSMMKAAMMEPDADLPARSLFDLRTIRPSHCELLKAKHLCLQTNESGNSQNSARAYFIISAVMCLKSLVVKAMVSVYSWLSYTYYYRHIFDGA